MAPSSAKYFGVAAIAALAAAFGCSEGSDGGGEATGGAPGTGGQEETGGGETGGAAETGGEATGGTEEQAEVLFDFSEDLEGFALDVYYNADYPNLADMVDNGEDTIDDAAEGLSLDWSDAEGPDGSPGVVQIAAPYSDWDQSVNIQADNPIDPDMSGHILRARVKILDDGGYVNVEGAAGGGFIYAKSGEDWTFGRGDWISLTANDYGEWVELVFELDLPGDEVEGFDPTEIRSLGIQIAVGSCSACDEDEKPTAANFLIDQITIE